jgi:beta-galactosidase/beta-glucuronidase
MTSVKTKILLATFFAALALGARGADWNVVASFDAARADDLSKAGGAAGYVYLPEEIPVSALPADSGERKVIYGGKLVLAWAGAKPGAQYKIKAAFLSDSESRSLRVELNGRTLEGNLSLPKWKVLEREWLVPAGMIADGDMAINLCRISGANAVLSRLEILSDAPQTLSAPPPLEEILGKMEVPMPRLSPRPVAVANVKSPLVSLNGVWKFNPAPPAGFEKLRAAQTKKWNKIEVPGEWVMQGFEVKTNSAAGYWRAFEMPADWQARRIKLRFDTVHSDCQVFVNGQEVGAHEGCFTAFELDITAAVKPGRNTLSLSVNNESTADTLASATQYAAHQLGGITREVRLFALPEINVASQILTTTFDKEFKAARLNIHLDVANESSGDGEAVAKFKLVDSGGKVISAEITNLPAVRAGQTVAADITIPVASPRKWDSEHPNLYLLKTELLVAGKVAQEITQRVGFRQIEVRGNQLFVNGVPVKLRGVCRHEVDPVRGRSLTPMDWKKDAELFRAANVNYIRTSHYPPAEEFLDLCDEYGFFVECEAPLCWVHHGANSVWASWDYRDEKFFPLLLRANLENLAANRNHPCVTIWSLANESLWSPLFAEVNRRVKLADPTRPTSFHDQCWGGYNNAHSQADIAVYHYPGENGPAKCDAENRPVLFGEYCHVECYNRRELATDPGVRDDWGRGFARMSDLMYQHDGCLGGAIWAGIDDVFCLPNGKFIGYGMWGSICDGWRRDKPETWHVKKSYSPVRATTDRLPLPAAGESIRVPVENRYNFANMSEAGIAWNIAGANGKVRADIPARHKGEIVIPPPVQLKNGEVLHLVFTDPRGFVCDEENIILGNSAADTAAVAEKFTGKLSVAQTNNQIQIRGGNVEYVIDRKTGQFISGRLNGKTILTGGPALMILPLQNEACEPVDLGIWNPLNNVCENWKAESVEARESRDGAIEVAVKGSTKEADGGYVIHLDAAGGIKVSYDFSSNVRENPRQWGMVFFAPKIFGTLHWNRTAQWSFYPAGHIGRAVGTATAHIATGIQPYATHLPLKAWPLDATELGGNDFSSTKVAIHEASLTDRSNRLRVTSDGHQSIRAFLKDDRIGLLVAGFHSGGGDGFFSMHFAAERKPLNSGSKLSDTIQLRLADD